MDCALPCDEAAGSKTTPDGEPSGHGVLWRTEDSLPVSHPETTVSLKSMTLPQAILIVGIFIAGAIALQRPVQASGGKRCTVIEESVTDNRGSFFIPSEHRVMGFVKNSGFEYAVLACP